MAPAIKGSRPPSTQFEDILVECRGVTFTPNQGPDSPSLRSRNVLPFLLLPRAAYVYPLSLCRCFQKTTTPPPTPCPSPEMFFWWLRCYRRRHRSHRKTDLRQGDAPLQQHSLHRWRGFVRRGGWSLGTVFREIPRGNGRRVRLRSPRNVSHSRLVV